MEIPCSHAGVVKELKVAVGDKVKEGSLVLTLEAAGDAAAPVLDPKQAPAGLYVDSVATQTVAPAVAVTATSAPAPASASFEGTPDLGLKVILVERYAALGGVCLNVGCIPSKALLHVAAVMDEVSHLGALGIEFGAPTVNIDLLRGHKDKVITKLTGGLAAMAKMRKVTVVRGYGAFVGANHVSVEETSGTAQEKTGKTQTIAFKKAASSNSKLNSKKKSRNCWLWLNLPTQPAPPMA